jgi:hypothetical protein
MGVARLLHILLLLQICSHTQAYAFSKACEEYGPKNVDLRPWLKESIAETKRMLEKIVGEHGITKPYAERHQYDNAHSLLWFGISEDDLEGAKGSLVLIRSRSIAGAILTLIPIAIEAAQNVLNMPYWEPTEHGSLILDGLTFYCGGDELVPQDDDNWLDTSSNYVFRADVSRKPTGWGDRFCRNNEKAAVLLGNIYIRNKFGVPGEEDIGIIVLCPGMLLAMKGAPVRSENPEFEAASFAMVQRQGMLKKNEQLSNSLEHVWSVTILHELFHYRLDDESKHLPNPPLNQSGMTGHGCSV